MTVESDPTPGCIDAMLIPCPWCGLRDEREFDYGGSDIRFPSIGKPDNHCADDWNDAVHMRDNTKGDIREIWYHRAGCERWIAVTRNTATHDFATSSGSDKTENSENMDAD